MQAVIVAWLIILTWLVLAAKPKAKPRRRSKRRFVGWHIESDGKLKPVMKSKN